MWPYWINCTHCSLYSVCFSLVDQATSGSGKTKKGSTQQAGRPGDSSADRHPRAASSRSQPLNLSQVTFKCCWPHYWDRPSVCRRQHSPLCPGTAGCDVVNPRPNRKQQFPEAAAHVPPSCLLPLVLQHPLQLHPEPVRLPGLCRPGLRVPSCGPDARRLVPPRQGERGLLVPGSAAEERQPGPGRVSCSGTVRQPTPPTAAAATAAAGRAAFPPLQCSLPAKTQPVPLPVKNWSKEDQNGDRDQRGAQKLITADCDRFQPDFKTFPFYRPVRNK